MTEFRMDRRAVSIITFI